MLASPVIAGLVLEILFEPLSGRVPVIPVTAPLAIVAPVTVANVALFDPKFAVVGVRVSLLLRRSSPLNRKAWVPLVQLNVSEKV